jgi:hypothetical protein
VITEIEVKNVATYSESSVKLGNLKKSTFFMVQMVVERQHFQD